MRTRFRGTIAAAVVAAVLWPSLVSSHVAGPLRASVKMGEVDHSGDYAIIRGKIKVTNTANSGIPPLVSCTVLLTLSDGDRMLHSETFPAPPGSTKKKRFTTSSPDLDNEVRWVKGKVKHCHR